MGNLSSILAVVHEQKFKLLITKTNVMSSQPWNGPKRSGATERKLRGKAGKRAKRKGERDKGSHLNVVDSKLQEPAWQQVPCRFGRSITDVGMRSRSLLTAPDTTVDTPGLTPRGVLLLVNAVEEIRLVTQETLGALLDNLSLNQGSYHL